MSNVKNYREQGGDKWVIDGELELTSNATLTVTSGATVSGIVSSAYILPEATASAIGGVKLAAEQADSTATDAAGLVTDFNALLAKLRTAGILAPDTE